MHTLTCAAFVPPQVHRVSATKCTPSIRCKRRASQSLTAAWSGFATQKTPEPAWVETHKGIPNVVVDKPDNPCKVCSGHGKVTCGTCDGKGIPHSAPHDADASAVNSVSVRSAPSIPRSAEYYCKSAWQMPSVPSAQACMQEEQMGHSIGCCQVGCGQHGARAAGAVVCGTVKGMANYTTKAFHDYCHDHTSMLL